VQRYLSRRTVNVLRWAVSAHHFCATNPRTQPPLFRAKPVKDIGQYSPSYLSH